MKVASIVLGVCLLLSTAACQSTPMKLPSASIGPNEKALGQTEGSSTGIMLFGFIPIIQNTRFENAYAEAVQKGGGTRLTDITISEQWFWALVLNGYIFTVQGTAVGNK
ncbi:MAG: hypothetical protein Q8L77_10305 [Nitrospirota bacterium]|nr:hypothetical protein [Nitrospirota bacterium]